MIDEQIHLKGVNPEWIKVPKGCNVTWNKDGTAKVYAENQKLIEEFKENLKNPKEPEKKESPFVKEIRVKFTLPFSINLPNDTYPIKHDEFICNALIRKKLTRDNAAGMIGDMHISDDRFGLANNTLVVTRFVLKQPIRQDEISKKQLKMFSLKSVNLILNSCRWLSNDYYNHDIVVKDLAGTNYDFLDDSSEILTGTSVLIGGGGIMSLSTSGSTVDEAVQDSIRQNLSSNVQLPFVFELIKNSIDYFRFENYRMACIEIETAIEIVLSKILTDYLQTLQQTDAAQVQQYLDVANIPNLTIPEFPRCRWDVIKPVLRMATFNSITGDSECQNWKDKCQDMRHSVVHGGYSPTKNEAKEAIQSGLDFFRILQQYEQNLASQNITITFPPDEVDEFVMEDQSKMKNLSLSDFEDITNIDFNKITEKTNEGNLFFKNKQFTEAISSFNEVLAIDPLNVDILINKGNALQGIQDFPMALDCYQKAILVDEREKILSNNIANVFANLGQLSQSLRAYRDALRIDPDYIQAIINKGITFLQMNNSNDALCCFNEAVEKQPSNSKAWFFKAIVYADKSDKKNFLENLAKAIKFDSEYKNIAKKEKRFEKYFDDEDFKNLVKSE